MDIHKLKHDILEYAQSLYKDKLVAATSGNISFFDRENNIMAITPSSQSYMKMGTENIMILDACGNIIEGVGRPSSEWQMHAEIYKSRSDINSVVHTHSPYATAFAVLNEDIPIILVEMVPYLKGDLKVSKFALPGTADVGKVALEVLKNRNACLLANHGVVAVGADVEEAYTAAAYAEDVAKIYGKAKTLGVPVMVDKKSVEAMNLKYFGKAEM